MTTMQHSDLKKSETLDDAKREQITGLLRQAYNDEIETVANYLANSIHLDGMLAQEVKESLSKDIQEELNHAKLLAHRLKVLGGGIPGSVDLKMTQHSLRPPESTIDVVSVIKGVIEAEDSAIDTYQKLIEVTGDETDPVTQDLAVNLKGDEEEHRREFVGFLREYDALMEMFKGG